MVKKPTRFLWAGLMFCLCFSVQSQDNPGSESLCDMELTTSSSSEGGVTICYSSIYMIGGLTASCTSTGSYTTSAEGGRGGCLTMSCCPDAASFLLTWQVGQTPCHTIVQVSCCTGPDSDGDGICDEEDCHPDDSGQAYGPGDPCDDGDPATFGDRYDENCNCTGDPDEGCLVGDSDGDGICDDADCWPHNPALTYAAGDFCNDGDPLTYNDHYDENCECSGEPLPCGDLWPDDGCPLTTDVINGDCTVSYLPPDVDDGCDLTYDYFDPVNCVIVNELPDVDDGCIGTRDYFDASRCEIVNEVLPCDDNDITTVGDKYDDNCECQGCDPCQLQGEKWVLLCELLNR